ncbi:uncharacterized protein PG986_004521 [Apiospora aurea]|uniref:Ankyrin repeat domain-containing protein n=1 Tax=Apiospora aurea TaxID=335848 RepID=A0ABR1QNB1_9PEZI
MTIRRAPEQGPPWWLHTGDDVDFLADPLRRGDVVGLLVDAGTPVAARGHEACTPLHYAALQLACSGLELAPRWLKAGDREFVVALRRCVIGLLVDECGVDAAAEDRQWSTLCSTWATPFTCSYRNL